MVTDNNEKLQDLTVEEKLQNLYELQQIDSEINKIVTLRGELPLEVQDLEDEIAGLSTRIENLKAELEELKKTTVQRNVDIKRAEDSIHKYSEQMQDVRNNRQYDALSKEVEFQNLEIELQKKRIGEAQRFIREKEMLMEEAVKRYDEKNIDLEAKKGELNDIIGETHKEEETLRVKSQKLSAAIDDRLLLAYRRIRDNARNGLGVVTVDRDACGGCFNKIPPQRQLDIRSRKKIIVCEYCGRILIDKYICDYDGSRAQADLEARAESQKRKSRRTKREE
ncbi:MAG: C4-type zinc ribbon domain-containing protein [Odoribacteraceae bacterium]|jgi:predicted  nucleic acid-binding Zn-ribbon protein|nr:C4-type zinc ribbon domain-containing protein [Odoribacteraceae bacterium]